MDKRFQFFISSTFTDLKDERQAVLKAVLELNQMPAGMELFPASDDSAWRLIQDVIDGSDYYLLIIGGRYGSVDDEGIGYTEKEYEYALRRKKPVIAFLHEDPGALARDKTETEAEAWKKLQAFRAKGGEKAYLRLLEIGRRAKGQSDRGCVQRDEAVCSGWVGSGRPGAVG